MNNEIIKNEYLQLIINVGVDYDGCTTIEDLKALIDDMVDYAKLAKANDIKTPIYITEEDKKFNILMEEV